MVRLDASQLSQKSRRLQAFQIPCIGPRMNPATIHSEHHAANSPKLSHWSQRLRTLNDLLLRHRGLNLL